MDRGLHTKCTNKMTKPIDGGEYFAHGYFLQYSVSALNILYI